MNPLAIKPLVLLGALLAALLAGFGGGWTVNGWRLHTEIADAKAARANEIATQSQAALKDFKDAAATIKAEADNAHLDLEGLDKKLNLIRKDFQNAKPLPVDCKPDDVRVRKLTSTLNAVNQTVSGQRVSSGLPANP